MSENDKHFEYGRIMNEQASHNANIVLRTLLMVNGGAAVALLAFVGRIVSLDVLKQSSDVSGLTLPLLWFGWGVVAAVIAMTFAYFTNYLNGAHSFALHAKDGVLAGRVAKAKTFFHVFAIISTAASLGFFVYGLFQVREAITTLML